MAVVIGNTPGLGSWGFTGLALVAGLLVTLLDRQGFYGTPRTPLTLLVTSAQVELQRPPIR